MVDIAHSLTDKKLEEMEKRLSAIYSRAEKEIQKTADEYFSKFAAQDDKKRKLLEQGKITEEEYTKWCKGKVMYGKRFTEMKEQCAQQLLNVNKTAMAYINGELPEVYAINYNALESAAQNVIGGKHMAKKIYISPSDQTGNRYAVGNTNEAEQCRKIASALVDALERCGFDGIAWNTYGCRIAWYNADYSLKGSVTAYDKIDASIYFPTKVEDANAAAAFSTDINVAPPNGAAYFRVSAKGSGVNLIVTLDEEIV